MAATTQTVSSYLKKLGPKQRAALNRLRRDIKAAAPGAVECISYKIPAFRFRGRMLVWFGAHEDHLAFYPGAQPIRVHKDALKGYKTSIGTIRFSADKPLPAALVRKLVKTRIAEHARKRST